MDTSDAGLAELSLNRLAEAQGDITEQVLDRYYRRHPGARGSFEHHGVGDTAELEGRMVTATLFLMLQWAEDANRTRIEQGTTIVHHHDALEIGPQWYLGLIDAVLEVIVESIPGTKSAEIALWLRVRQEIADFIESVREEFVRADNDGGLPGFRLT